MTDNVNKAQHGANVKKDLLFALRRLRDDGFISVFSTAYRTGYPEFSSDQFYSPYYIEFSNREGWILHSTTTVRNDRMNIQQWNSLHIKKINPLIKKAYVVVPNEIVNNKREYNEVLRYCEKIDRSEFYSSIDGVLTQSQLIGIIKEKK
jgi:preprotein translocase subunit Sss1